MHLSISSFADTFLLTDACRLSALVWKPSNWAIKEITKTHFARARYTLGSPEHTDKIESVKNKKETLNVPNIVWELARSEAGKRSAGEK